MMRSLTILFALTQTLWLAPGARAIDVPGLGLDHPALQDPFVGDCCSSAPFGRRVSVKGADNYLYNGIQPSQGFGMFHGGIVGGPAYLQYGFGGSNTVGFRDLSSTLLPPFALGAAMHVTQQGGFDMQGPYIQGVIYEPDQVQRKQNAKKASVQIKQKSYLAFRFGQFRGSGPGSVATDTPQSTLVVEACKGQATVTRDMSKNAYFTKFKVKCSGKSSAVELIRAKIEEIVGKAKSGFDLRGQHALF